MSIWRPFDLNPIDTWVITSLALAIHWHHTCYKYLMNNTVTVVTLKSLSAAERASFAEALGVQRRAAIGARLPVNGERRGVAPCESCARQRARIAKRPAPMTLSHLIGMGLVRNMLREAMRGHVSADDAGLVAIWS